MLCKSEPVCPKIYLKNSMSLYILTKQIKFFTWYITSFSQSNLYYKNFLVPWNIIEAMLCKSEHVCPKIYSKNSKSLYILTKQIKLFTLYITAISQSNLYYKIF